MSATALSLRIFLFLSFSTFSSAFNITAILSPYPQYAIFNTHLSLTNLSNQINSRQTITVLTLSNSAMKVLSPFPLTDLQNQLALHVLLDYFDRSKLREIDSDTTVATLFQTTGKAAGMNGFLVLKGGEEDIYFRSYTKGVKERGAKYLRSVKEIPYNISVIEINAPIDAGILKGISPSPSKSPRTSPSPSESPLKAPSGSAESPEYESPPAPESDSSPSDSPASDLNGSADPVADLQDSAAPTIARAVGMFVTITLVFSFFTC